MKFVPSAVIAAAILLTGTTVAPAQDVKAKTAPQVFGEIRDLVAGGSLEVAADLMRDFVALNPTPQDYLDLEAKYGPTTFLKLKLISRWYDDPKRNAAFVKDVLTKVVDGSIKANETLLKDPKRVDRFVRNLGGITEEYRFALAELKRSGDFVVPFVVDSLRIDTDPMQRAGVLKAVTELGPETIPGFLIAAENLSDEFRLMLIGAINRRPDFLNLINQADTNIVPFLWYLSATPSDAPNPLATAARTKLRELFPAAFDRRSAVEELTRAAQPLHDRKAAFHNFDSARNTVKLWTWDAKKQNVAAGDVAKSVAEEAFGLQYLRWALERNGKSEPAQDLFLAFATERAVERAKFADLAASDANAYRILAAAPASTLIRLLDQALPGNRTALALGLVQALGDRAEVAAGTTELKPGGGTRPAVLVKALDYPDPRVQLAAALALLKIPNANHGANSRILEVLKRAVSAEAGAAANKGKAIVADGSVVRGDQIANVLRGVGYQVEVVGNGRQLAKRIDGAADFDVVLVDRHIVSPTLEDLIPQIRADKNLARRPLMIVASADARQQLGLETLLARLASLVSATETLDVNLPPIPEADPRKPREENAANRAKEVARRDRTLQSLYETRLARLERLVQSANIKQPEPLKRRLDLRLPQLTMGAMVAEFELTATSAPKMIRDFNQLTDLIRRQTDLDIAVENVDTQALVRLEQQLEQVLTPELKAKFETVHAHMDVETLALAKETAVDPATSKALESIARRYPGVSVIREPYSKVGFEQDLAAAMPDAAQRPRDPAEKAAAAKAAVDALRKLATGETPGFDATPAADALRTALANDTLAPVAAAALARINSGAAQTDLVLLAANATRTPAIRTVAAESAVRNVQAFGKTSSTEAIAAINKAADSGAIAVLKELLNPRPLADALKGYTPTPAVEAKKDASKPEEKKDEPKPDEKKEGN